MKMIRNRCLLSQDLTYEDQTELWCALPMSTNLKQHTIMLKSVLIVLAPFLDFFKTFRRFKAGYHTN